MFVYPKTTPGAYFHIGEDEIPAIAGTLVTFKGNAEVHNMVVPVELRSIFWGPIRSRDIQGIVGSTRKPGVCFEAVKPQDCPRSEYLGLEYLFNVHQRCDHNVPVGELCEADGGKSSSTRSI